MSVVRPNDGVTVARRAYSAFQARFSGPRWGRLAHRGATPQRPLWFPPSPGPARSAVALTQQLAGRNCIVAVRDDVATGLERYESPAVAHCGLEDPSDVVAPMDVTDTGDEDLVRAQEANALETSRRAYDAVLATLRARVATSD